MLARSYSAPHRDVVRAKIVLLAADGLSNEEIAARLDTPRQIVSKWRKRFYEQRLTGLQDRPRSGRPPAQRTSPGFSSGGGRGDQGAGMRASRYVRRAALPLARSGPCQGCRQRGIVASISGTTVWRWLSADAIRPWQHRSWVFPRDPDFAEKAGRVLDLYQRRFAGETLERKISSYAPTRRPPYRRVPGSTPPYRQLPDSRFVSSTSMNGAGRWPIWLAGTSTAPDSSVVVSLPPESDPFGVWSSR